MFLKSAAIHSVAHVLGDGSRIARRVPCAELPLLRAPLLPLHSARHSPRCLRSLVATGRRRPDRCRCTLKRTRSNGNCTMCTRLVDFTTRCDAGGTTWSGHMETRTLADATPLPHPFSPVPSIRVGIPRPVIEPRYHKVASMHIVSQHISFANSKITVYTNLESGITPYQHEPADESHAVTHCSISELQLRRSSVSQHWS